MHASQQCSRYVVQGAASTLDFEAKSSLHPVHGKGSQLTGYIDAVCAGLTVAVDPPPVMHVEFPAERLTSGNALQDKETWKLLDTKRHPLIRADLRDLRSAGGTDFAAGGEITLRGKARTYEGPLRIACTGDDLTIDGSLQIDIRDFGIAPPRFLLFTVQPNVTIRLHLAARLG